MTSHDWAAPWALFQVLVIPRHSSSGLFQHPHCWLSKDGASRMEYTSRNQEEGLDLRQRLGRIYVNGRQLDKLCPTRHRPLGKGGHILQ